MAKTPWDDTNDMKWTVRAFELAQMGQLRVTVSGSRGAPTASVTGTCPRCEHDVQWSTALDATVPQPSRTLTFQRSHRPTAPSVLRLDVICSCEGFDHPGRPPEVKAGCGATFRLIET